MMQIEIVIEESRDIGDVERHAGQDVDTEQPVQCARTFGLCRARHGFQETMVSET